MLSGQMKTVLLFVCVIIFTISFYRFGLLRGAENFFLNTITVVTEKGYVWNKMRDFKKNNDYASLYEKYVNLEREALELKAKNVNTVLLQEENHQLRAQLQFFVDTPYRHVGAEVIGEIFDTAGKTVLVNRGENDGVAVGNPVVAGQGIIVGKVVKTSSSRAFVELLPNSNSKIAATLMNKEKSVGLVEGGYGISVHMNFIPQNEKITVGDSVITSGLEEHIPRGLLIGTVEAVEKEIYQPFQKAIITPIADFDTLTVVSIIVEKP